MGKINISYLIPHLRLYIGDTNQDNYRYTNDWLEVALAASIKSLSRWWGDKYILDETTNEASRNEIFLFDMPEPPVIQRKDERPIILMAAIILLEGSLENNAWNLVSWRDNEISFSNLESGRIKDRRIERMWNELISLIKPPTRRLAFTHKRSLPGYKGNIFEEEV